jgi:tetraacyldisaccharide 4'-kinase
LRVPLEEPSWWYRDSPSAIATWLTPLASVYGWVATNRYARTIGYRARPPVICAGNFTAGGTGKTPLVVHLCEHLLRTGQRPAVLTRGYGGRHAGPHWVSTTDTASDVGDEAVLLARAAPTLLARDRSVGARAIEQEPHAANIIIMDDGLQNAQLCKDLAIAVIDGTRGLGNGLVIPAGPLRGPLQFQLGLADAIVVNQVSPDAGDRVAEWLRHRFNGPVLRSATIVRGDSSWLKAQRVVAWAGIGAPHRFFATLKALVAQLAEAVSFRDHQRLVPAAAERLLLLARQHQALLVSTEKDLARLKDAFGVCAELAAATRALPIKLKFADPDADRLSALVEGAIKRRAR